MPIFFFLKHSENQKNLGAWWLFFCSIKLYKPILKLSLRVLNCLMYIKCFFLVDFSVSVCLPGSLVSLLLDRPSCPLEFRPQDSTWPLIVRNKVCCSPQDIWTSSSLKFTEVGVVIAFPPCPLEGSPQRKNMMMMMMQVRWCVNEALGTLSVWCSQTSCRGRCGDQSLPWSWMLNAE